MNTYEARWQNAKRIAEKIIEMQEKGWIIFDENNEAIMPFAITKDGDGGDIIAEVCSNITIKYFVNNKDWDEGLYTSIAEYNKRFKDWKCIDPKNIVPLPLE